VPRFYLAGFTAAGESLWVYEKDKRPRQSKPQAEGFRNDFYAFERDGEKQTEVESLLARIEAETAPVIRALANRNPTECDRRVLARFIGIMIMRTPLARSIHEGRLGPALARRCQELAPDPVAFAAYFAWAQLDPVAIEDYRQSVLAGEMERLHESAEYALSSMLAIGERVAGVLLELNWLIVRSKDESFVTSDCPVVTELHDVATGKSHYRSGVGNNDIWVWFPLSRSCCLVLSRHVGNQFAISRGAGVRSINKKIMQNAERFLYSGRSSVFLQRAFDKHGCATPLESLDLRFEGLKY